MSKKIIGVILAITSFLVGLTLLGGILGILLGVAAATWCLKYFKVVSPDSIWISESKSVNRVTYIILAVFIIFIITIGYIAINQ